MAYKNYTVVKGDSLWKIANANGVTVADLRKANPRLAKSDLIHPGDVLKVPVPNVSDTSETIRKQFNTALNDIQNLPSVKKLLSLLEG